MLKTLQFFGRLPEEPSKKTLESKTEAARIRGEVLREFFEVLTHANAQKRVLVLDYDGTLAPLVVDPLQAYPYIGVVERLDAIMETGTRMVIATGRKVVEIPPLLLLRHPIEICGVHGWEQQLPDGTFTRTLVPIEKRRALDRVEEWMAEAEKIGGWYERKHASIVLHWRALMEAGDNATIAALIAHVDIWWKKTGTEHLSRYPTDGGVEIRAKGWDKGMVVESLTKDADIAAFMGDDTTDEDAFRRIKHTPSLRNKVLGILVKDEWRSSSDATAHLRPPTELLSFFDRWIDVCRGVRPTLVSLPQLYN